MLFLVCIFSTRVLLTKGHLRDDSRNPKSQVRIRSGNESSLLSDTVMSESTNGSSFRVCESLTTVPKFVIAASNSSERFLQFSKSAANIHLRDICRVQADLAGQCDRHVEVVIGTSHRKVWQHIVQENIPFALVFEDDALGTISPDFCDKIHQLAADRSTSSFDVARLHSFKSDRHPEVIISNGSSGNLELIDHDKGCAAFGTAGYAITLRGARLSLEAWTKDVGFPVDHYFAYSAVKNGEMKVKCVIPPIFDVQRVNSYRKQLSMPHAFRAQDDENHGYYTQKEKYSVVAGRRSDITNGRNQGVGDCADPLLMEQCADFKQ